MYLDDAVSAIAGFEGRVHWMYLDTKGNVTVGVGEMLPTADDASRYPFRCQNAQFATADEIVAQFEAVKKMEPGLKPLAYRRFESLLLSDEDIDLILRGTLAGCDFELSAMFPDFHAYPNPAKVGLLDMRFNLGATRLRNEFPIFCKSVGLRHWHAAAVQCHRLQPGKERNQWAQSLFVLAGSLDDPAAKEIA